MAKGTTRPWMAGIVDTLVGAEYLRRSTIPHRNRLAVILIDSAFETACRAYLKHVEHIRLQESHRHRENLVKATKGKLKEVDKAVWENIDFYYSEIRNDFYHESAGKTITDTAVLDYKDTVEFVINTAFGVRISDIVDPEVDKLNAAAAQFVEETSPSQNIRVTELSDRVDKVLVAVGILSPSKVDSVNEFLKREGDSLRLKPEEFTNIVARNSGSKKFFFHSKDSKNWELSGLGKFKLGQIEKGNEDGE